MIEAVSAAMNIIPVTLVLLDLLVLVIANSMNDSAAKNAARAAANQSDAASAFNAANKSLESFKPSSIIPELKIQTFNYPNAQDIVTCKTRMKVVLPVPFPGYHQLTFEAQAAEPVVGTK